MRVEWARTALAAVVFLWLVFAWHRHESLGRHERTRLDELITAYCASQHDLAGGVGSVRPATDRERQECEIGLRQRSLGGSGVAVSGSVDVSGNVSVEP